MGVIPWGAYSIGGNGNSRKYNISLLSFTSKERIFEIHEKATMKSLDLAFIGTGDTTADNIVGERLVKWTTMVLQHWKTIIVVINNK